jgi:hypothetical protein
MQRPSGQYLDYNFRKVRLERFAVWENVVFESVEISGRLHRQGHALTVELA